MGGLLLCGSVLWAPRAWADSAELHECDIEGAACKTARVPNGTCTFSRCWFCNGSKAMTYTCPRCLSEEDLAAAGAPSGPINSKPSCSDEDDSGCTVHQLGNERGIGAVFLAIGLGAFLLGRRRRKTP
jgi:hypothetical protein